MKVSKSLLTKEDYYTFVFHNCGHHHTMGLCISNIKSYMKDMVKKEKYEASFTEDFMTSTQATTYFRDDASHSEFFYFWFAINQKLMYQKDKSIITFVPTYYPTFKGLWIAHLGTLK